jgi:hypothetical protein
VCVCVRARVYVSRRIGRLFHELTVWWNQSRGSHNQATNCRRPIEAADTKLQPPSKMMKLKNSLSVDRLSQEQSNKLRGTRSKFSSSKVWGYCSEEGKEEEEERPELVFGFEPQRKPNDVRLRRWKKQQQTINCNDQAQKLSKVCGYQFSQELTNFPRQFAHSRTTNSSNVWS